MQLVLTSKKRETKVPYCRYGDSRERRNLWAVLYHSPRFVTRCCGSRCDISLIVFRGGQDSEIDPILDPILGLDSLSRESRKPENRPESEFRLLSRNLPDSLAQGPRTK